MDRHSIRSWTGTARRITQPPDSFIDRWVKVVFGGTHGPPERSSLGEQLQISRLLKSVRCVRLHNIKSADINKRLKAEGWVKVGGKGDHEKFKHPNKPGHLVVPHPRKDMPLGTLRNIFRQAGWDWR